MGYVLRAIGSFCWAILEFLWDLVMVLFIVVMGIVLFIYLSGALIYWVLFQSWRGVPF